MEDPKDKVGEHIEAAPRELPADKFRIEAPSGMDLHPEPRRVVRLSKRTNMAVIGISIALLLAFAYGGYRRAAHAKVAARRSSLPKNVVPATEASNEFTDLIPAGTVPLERTSSSKPEQSHKPGAAAGRTASFCGVDPRTKKVYRYDPQTGRPCGKLPQESLAVRQAPVLQQQSVQASATPSQPTPEEQRLADAYRREQEAELAPTAVRVSNSSSNGTSFAPSAASGPLPSGDSDLSRIAALTRALRGGSNTNRTAQEFAGTLGSFDDKYARQNMQSGKKAFLAAARKSQSSDYLRSVRVAPLSKYEIKAGWEIPAILEQNLNSDLPGELKALVSSNVYDTATGRYLLIPQGSRLIGKYDSRVSYGQNGVQVAWNRIIFPDASSIDLDGMVGLDSQGNAGLRYKVDHHYKRLIGFSALTSLFNAAFAISQRGNRSVLAYPTPGEAASQAVGQQLSQMGSQMTRRNLNVQPTIKVPAGYKFTVRVNRDILFDAPYRPMRAEASGVLAATTKGEGK